MLTIQKDVEQKYPGIHFGIMTMKNLRQVDPPKEFIDTQEKVIQGLQKKFKNMEKKEMRNVAPLSDYHNYYKTFKKTYHVLHQCESIITGKRSLRGGAPLLQAMFMAEVKNQLLTAGYDTASLEKPYSVSLADGNSTFTGLGDRTCTPLLADIIFSDGRATLGSIICGPDHFHQIRSTTTSVLFALYGVPGVTTQQIESHFEDIRQYVQLSCPEAETASVEII